MTHSRYRFGLITILVWFVIILCGFFAINLNPFNPENAHLLSKTETILLSIAAIGPAIAYLIIEAKTNRAKISWIVLPLVVVFVGINLAGIWLNTADTYTIGELTLNLNMTTSDRVFATLRVIGSGLVLYIMFGLLPRRIVRVKTLTIFYWLAVLGYLAAVAFSLIKEFDVYKQIFTSSELENYPSIMSFFYNENTYGQAMFIAVMVVVVINEIKPHWWHFIFIFIFVAAMIFTTSVTSLICTAALLVLYLFYSLFRTIKTKVARNTVAISIFILLVAGILITLLVLNKNDVSFAKNFFKFFEKTIINKNTDTFSGRTQVWADAFSLLQTPLDFLFGKGPYQIDSFMVALREAKYGVANSSSVDSGFVSTIVSQGLLGFLLYVVVLGLFLAICIYMMVKEKTTHIYMVSFIGVLVCLLYGGFESLIIIDTNYMGIATTLLFALPVLIKFNRLKHPEIEKAVMEDTNLSPHRFDRYSIAQEMSKYIYGLVFVLLTGLLFSSIRRDSSFFIYYVVIIVALAALGLFLPYLIGVWRGNNLRKHGFVLRVVFLLILLFMIPLGLGIGLYFVGGATLSAVSALISFLVIFVIEFVITVLTKSNIKEYFTILWNNVFKPHLSVLVAVVFIFVPGVIVMELFLDMSLLAVIALLIVLYMLYLLLYYVLPCGKANRLTKEITRGRNANYLHRQKMVFVLHKKD